MSVKLDELRKYIVRVARKTLQEEDLQMVVTGTIRSSEPGKYSVQLSSGNSTSLVDAFSIYTDKTYLVDDYVYLLKSTEARGSDYITKYFIFGLVEDTEQIFANLSEWERFSVVNELATIGPIVFNWDTRRVESIYTVDNASDFLYGLNVTKTFAISARVTAKASMYCNYGLLITITFEDGATKELSFDNNVFSGQPFNLICSEQHKVFKIIENLNVVGIKISVKLLEEDEYKIEASSFLFDDIKLEVGNIINLVDDFTVDLKIVNGVNFFSKNDINGQVQIQANVKYGNQKLDTNNLKYYWFIEDNSETNQVVLGQNGWRCLNESREVQVIDNDGNVVADPYNRTIYSTGEKTLTFNWSDAQEKLTKYTNKIKCVVGYQLFNAESEPVDIFNLSHEQYDVTVTLNSGQLPLMYADEVVTLKANLTSTLVAPKQLDTVEYRWYVNRASESIYYGASNLLKVGHNSENCNYVLDRNNTYIYCKVFLSEGGKQVEIASTEDNPYLVTTRVIDPSGLREDYVYEYYISTASDIKFYEYIDSKPVSISNGNGYDKTTDTFKRYKTNGNALVEHRDAVGDAAFAWLKDLGPFQTWTPTLAEGKYYLYYTKQRRIFDINENEYARYDDFDIPQILRYCRFNGVETLVDLLTAKGLGQLNEFNRLTNNGTSQGVKYSDIQYVLSTDEKPNEEKIRNTNGYYKYDSEKEEYVYLDLYYYANEADKEYNNYIFDSNGNIVGFKDNIEYYEKVGGELYINATYIRSGTLEVKDENQKPIFRASLEDTDNGLILAGFKAYAHSLESEDGKIGLFSGNKDDNLLPYFWVGGTKDAPATRLYGDGSGNIGALNIRANGDVASNGNGFYLGVNGSGRLGKLSYDIDGKVYVGDLGEEKFLVDTSGNIILKGTIDALGGSIGGFHITEDHLGYGEDHSQNESIYLSGQGIVPALGDDNQSIIFYAGSPTFTKDNENFVRAPLYFTKDGSFYATKGQIGEIKISEYGFDMIGLKIYPGSDNSGKISFLQGEKEIFWLERNKIQSITGATIDFNFIPSKGEEVKYKYSAEVVMRGEKYKPYIEIKSLSGVLGDALIEAKTFNMRGAYSVFVADKYYYADVTIGKGENEGNAGVWGTPFTGTPVFTIYDESDGTYKKKIEFFQTEKDANAKSGINFKGDFYINGKKLVIGE